jgi:hypothetical protein
MTDQQKPPKYDLCGIVFHYGTMSGGHYTASCLNSETKQWYDYNDSQVNEISDLNSLVNQNAYILVYQRRDTNSLTFKDLKQKSSVEDPIKFATQLKIIATTQSNNVSNEL